jgi:hypothetical protein
MAFQTTTLAVLIASPGDTTQERKAVEEAILGWNSDRTRAAKVHLLPLRWELDATPELGGGTAQEVINRQFADEADIVIGVFYSRLGQPTADAPSGTAEEIQRAVTRGAPVSTRPGSIWISSRTFSSSASDSKSRGLSAHSSQPSTSKPRFVPSSSGQHTS